MAGLVALLILIPTLFFGLVAPMFETTVSTFDTVTLEVDDPYFSEQGQHPAY